MHYFSELLEVHLKVKFQSFEFFHYIESETLLLMLLSSLLLISIKSILIHCSHSTFFIIFSGGRTVEGYPIITFPDTGTFWSLSDEDYHKLILYLTNVPT